MTFVVEVGPRLRPPSRTAGPARKPPPHSLGADHTAAELTDMMRVAAYENEQMQNAIAQCSAWLASDPKSFGDYSGRLHSLSEKLPPLLADAQDAVRTAPAYAPGDHTITTARYNELVAWRAALTLLYQEWKGDPHGCALPTFEHTPQPTAPDPGVDFLKTTQPVADALKAARQAGTWSLTTLPPIALLLLAYLVLREGSKLTGSR